MSEIEQILREIFSKHCPNGLDLQKPLFQNLNLKLSDPMIIQKIQKIRQETSEKIYQITKIKFQPAWIHAKSTIAGVTMIIERSIQNIPEETINGFLIVYAQSSHKN